MTNANWCRRYWWEDVPWRIVLSLLAIVISVTVAPSCTDEEKTRSTLEKAGFSEVETGGYSWFECGKGDSFHTKFRARNPAGEMVDGVVCCGWMKSCTIRF